MTTFIGNAEAIAALDAIVDSVDAGAGAGVLRIYAGSVPADNDAALGGATLLAELTMSDPAFGAAADEDPGAIATANAIADDSSANDTGTASFFRLLDSDLNSRMQGAVSTSGAELNLNTVSITAGVNVAVTSLVVRHPEG